MSGRLFMENKGVGDDYSRVMKLWGTAIQLE